LPLLGTLRQYFRAVGLVSLILLALPFRCVPDHIPPGGIRPGFVLREYRPVSVLASLSSVSIIFRRRCRFHCCYCCPQHTRDSCCLFRCRRFRYSVGSLNLLCTCRCHRPLRSRKSNMTGDTTRCISNGPSNFGASLALNVAFLLPRQRMLFFIY